MKGEDNIVSTVAVRKDPPEVDTIGALYAALEYWTWTVIEGTKGAHAALGARGRAELGNI